DAVTEEKIRELLLRRPMTFGELIQKFIPKKQNMTAEQKDEIIKALAAILQKINYESKLVNGKTRLSLKRS
ncbi:unnamed protein product, partial [Didymodactylos carnosus]